MYAAYHAIKITNNLGDIKSIKGKDMPGHDLLTYSFPCQDLSLQGKQAGLTKGRSSSMLWEVDRIVHELNSINKLPKYLLMENVPSILNINHKPGLNKWIKRLDKLGYKSHVFMLNAKYFGVPQNRKRAFVLSELNQNKFHINEPTSLTNKTIKSVIDERYNNNTWIPSRGYVENWNPEKKDSGIAITKILEYTTFGSEACAFSLDSISPTVTATGARSRIKVIYKPKKLRMLHSSELWKLMGFTKKDWNNINKHNIIPEQYLIKQAGNSIVVNVLEEIFKNVE